jgi:hypothetical protein
MKEENMPKKETKIDIEKKFTALDIIKGLAFCFLAYVFMVFLVAIIDIISTKVKIENPLVIIIGIAALLILGGFGVALSKVLEAGYGKNLITELLKAIKGK